MNIPSLVFGTRRRFAATTAGLVTAALVLSGCDFDGAYDLPLPGSPVSADEAYEVDAEFRDVLNVVPRSPVMVDDVTVGEVIEVERDGWNAVATLRIRDDVELPDNAIAEIRQVSLLGEKYVALSEPVDAAPSGVLGDNPDDRIPLARTDRNPEVEEVLGALAMLLRGGGVAQLGTITEELNNVMTGRQDRLRLLLGDLESFVGTLDDQKADIITALESVNNLSATLNREKDVIQEALDVTGPAIKVLADQHTELIGMLRSLDRLGRVGTRVINASKDNLIASLRSLRPILANLSAAGDQLAPGLNLLVSFPFPDEAQEIVLGDYANTSIIFEINLANFVDGNLLGIPGLPGLPDLPLGEILNLPAVLNCLTSGKIGGAACLKVMGSLKLLGGLKSACKQKKHRKNPVCRVMNQGLAGLTGSGAGLNLPGLPDLPGLGRLTTALTSGDAAHASTGSASTNRLLGGVS